jgi:hypothetical protein
MDRTCSNDVLSLTRITSTYTSFVYLTSPLSDTSWSRSHNKTDVPHTSSISPYHWAAPCDDNRTSAIQIFPSGPSLRLPLPVWENQTGASVSFPTITQATSPTRWFNETNATRSSSSPTVSYVEFSDGWSLRDSVRILIIWQALAQLFLMVSKT